MKDNKIMVNLKIHLIKIRNSCFNSFKRSSRHFVNFIYTFHYLPLKIGDILVLTFC